MYSYIFPKIEKMVKDIAYVFRYIKFVSVSVEIQYWERQLFDLANKINSTKNFRFMFEIF